MREITKVLNAMFLSFGLVSLAGCAQTVEWEEDVKLLDGQVVTVTQKKWCGGGDYNAKVMASCLARDAVVTMRFAEFSDEDIIWHERLNPMVINIYEGKLYIVGVPHTTVEFRYYGAVNPPYYGFVWGRGKWERIPFHSIPIAIYNRNMLIGSIPLTRTDHVSLEQKQLQSIGGGFIAPQFRIDPEYRRQPH